MNSGSVAATLDELFVSCWLAVAKACRLPAPGRDPDSHYIEVPRTGTSYVPEYLPESVIQFCDENPYCCGCPEIVMVRIHLLLLLCISSSVFAQQLQVPEIESQSAPDPLIFQRICTSAKPLEWLSIPRATRLLARQIKPAAAAAQMGTEIGWHTFRHTYSSMLRQLRVDVKATGVVATR